MLGEMAVRVMSTRTFEETIKTILHAAHDQSAAQGGGDQNTRHLVPRSARESAGLKS